MADEEKNPLVGQVDGPQEDFQEAAKEQAAHFKLRAINANAKQLVNSQQDSSGEFHCCACMSV